MVCPLGFIPAAKQSFFNDSFLIEERASSGDTAHEIFTCTATIFDA
ncbi:MAG: hypothetical protein V5A20_07535 [Salinibacter sp.]|jgi:hypothetical protein